MSLVSELLPLDELQLIFGQSVRSLAHTTKYVFLDLFLDLFSLGLVLGRSSVAWPERVIPSSHHQARAPLNPLLAIITAVQQLCCLGAACMQPNTLAPPDKQPFFDQVG